MASKRRPHDADVLMFGVETEYAASAFDSRGRPLDRAELVTYLTNRAAASTGNVRAWGCHSYDYFLQNGARLYIDCGLHPEYSGPECTTPEEVVSHAHAGNRLLGRAAERYRRDHAEVAEVLVSRCNVDYAREEATWGSHESYLHTCHNTSRLAEQLVPHLVSRIIMTGAGGFDNRSPGIEFMLTPRAVHLVRTSSSTTTTDRAIFNTKNEPLCKGYRRLHLICGESLCSHLADYLRVGTTALVIALIANKRDPGTGFKPCNPVQAMRVFARNPNPNARVLLWNGRHVSAIDIQRHYLQQVEEQLGAGYLPDWAELCCRRWRQTLDALEQGPDALATRLDWQIKLALFKQYARQKGFEWPQLIEWNQVARALHGLGRRYSRLDSRELVALADAGSREAQEVKRMTRRLEKSGLCWEQFDTYRSLRSALFEIDIRFSQLGERGIFNSLDGAGVLDHRIVSERRINRAMRHPPSVGRARLRGQIISEADGDSALYCWWDRVMDTKKNRWLDLSDPWNSVDEKWVN